MSACAFHGDVAARILHWYDFETKSWLCQSSETKDEWKGWNSLGESTVLKTAVLQQRYSRHLWMTDLDASEAPFFKWFVGGMTNAGFNEIDRHVLNGYGDRSAFLLEAPMSTKKQVQSCTYRDLLIESCLAAYAMRIMDMKQGSRLVLMGPNTLDQIIWIEAAKRMAIPYTCLPEGASVETTISRIRSLGARLVYISAGSGGLKSSLSAMISAIRKRCPVVTGGLLSTAIPTLTGRQQSCSHSEACEDAAVLRERALVAYPELNNVNLTDLDVIHAIWQDFAPVPVESNYPLFIAFTSGSTGEPKGLVHSHGTMASVCHTLSFSFGVLPPMTPSDTPADVALVVATPAWITGQSYMISACLTSGITSVLLEGSPVAPSATRFAHVIEKHKVTIFKAGSTFLRQVMADPRAIDELRKCNLSSVRAASFCAEPVSPTVHAFAIQHICPHYINSYWASEHGGIVFTRKYIPDLIQKADARCEPAPWVDARVMLTSGDKGMRDAKQGERGEIVLAMSKPFPSLARTMWGDKHRFEHDLLNWRGNLNSFRKNYFHLVSGKDDNDAKELMFIQGDWAEEHADGSFSFHGRSDDVMNVGGQRIGTGEIEAALFKHKKKPGSPVANCVVVGAADPIKGDLPVAFVVPLPGKTIDTKTRVELQTLAIDTVGVLAAPAYFIVVSALPQTRTGKYLRRMLRAIVNGESTDDTSNGIGDDALVNPESLMEAHQAVNAIMVASRGAVENKRNEASNAIRDIVVQLARDASDWQDARHKASLSGDIVSENIPLDQSLMHLGFDSMRLVLFRDSILRCLPTEVSPPLILMQLFGSEGLETCTLMNLVVDIAASVSLAQEEGLLTTAWPMLGNNEDVKEGWRTGKLKSARVRSADAGILLERDNRGNKALNSLKPKGGLEACFRGDLVTAQKLVQQGDWCAAHAVCQQESTAVMWAATGGHLDVLKWLINDMKCDVNARNKVGRTAIMFAAKYGHHDCVRWLVEEGRADIRIRAADDSDVFAWAVFGADIPTLETVAALIEPSDIHHKNKFGCTAIHWAATGGDVTVLKWLYARQLDFSVVNHEMYGAVNKAAYQRHKEALEWLLVDAAGPKLTWQLKHVPEKQFDSLHELIDASGLGSVSDFLKANATKLTADQIKLC